MRINFFIIFCFLAFSGNAQLLSWSPSFITDTTSTVTITCDATQGNQGLNNYTPTSDVYVHIGLITSSSTSSSNWLHVPSFSTWGTTNSQIQTTSLGNNKWQYTITGGLRSFFGVTGSSETILKIAILFRNGNGSLKQANIDGSDMYVPVYAAATSSNLLVRLDAPFRQPLYTPTLVPLTKKVGDNVSITANANQNSNITLFFNGTQVGSVATNTQTASATGSITAAGTQTIVAQANNGTTTTSDTSTFFISSSNTFAALPPGVVDGINYEAGDTSAILVLYAPHKSQIVVVGDFNNWTQSSAYQMNETPDSLRYWIRLTHLTAGTEYAYQYVIDGSLIVADYNAEKILDKANDQYISSATYPNLKTFPSAASGNIVSVLQTAKPAYNWQVTNFTRPDKRNLSIYELWVGNFTAAQNYQAIKDTLSYLKRLGINAIELMPINEFEGNVSWGYNPNFYFAPDKYYGTENALRQLIDACHQQGIAVIMDMVMNHSFGSSPMVQMYWDAAKNIPATNNPWFNQYATHAYNVGYQFNHQSQATIDFRNRVIRHWLTKYKVDGFRWDLAKGFTQTNTCDATGNNCNVTTWGNYDAGRVATWKNIYDTIQSVSPNAYCILEMFADNSEETVEANYGMLIWGNMNSAFNQATMGYSNPSWDLSYGVYTNRGYNSANLVTYQESHDEERLMNRNELYGNSNGSYNVKDTATGLKRNAMAAAFWAMIPGPKMMWQFGELGFDYSINTCSDLTINNNCRLSQKPLGWNYYANANRYALYNVYSKLLNLRNTPKYFNTFTTGAINYNLSGAFKSLIVTSDSLSVVVVGNVDVTAQTGSVTFPTAGTWYSYLTGTTITASGAAQSITLQPGEYYVYTNRNSGGTLATAVVPVNDVLNDLKLIIAPNPVNGATIIEYYLPENGNVLMNVVDMNGKKITTLVNGFKAKGKQSIAINSNGFNTNRFAGGMYLLQLLVNGKERTEKFIITK
ncbi:malto-oligosyltrehalose trehalohydrolase [mine drainage metagenome]|uniref:Malto-oligosyltrehalose trehalohydrolase n=1 Tax=mine drainage metagenome TaxID=410659 RepID=A0A1J5SIW9_9ZZZZ